MQNRYKFEFKGRQTGAIGAIYSIRDTYKAETLGQALYMLNKDYECIRELRAWEEDNRYFNVLFEAVSAERLETTEPSPIDYPQRETSPKTGSYKYLRDDAPDDYNY